MTPRTTRRTLLRTTAATAGALSLASLARSSRPADAQEGGTLRVYWNAGHMYDAYQAVVNGFKADHPGWDVSMEPFQWPDLRTKILADFAAGNPPDLTEEPGGWAQEFGVAGYLRPLDDYIAADGPTIGYPNDWQDVTINRHIVNGQTFGIQLHLTCILLFYNRTMLTDAGYAEPPTNWDQFLEVAQATTKGNVFGFAQNQDPGYSWPWYLQNGVSLYDPASNQLTMATDTAFEALQFQVDMIHRHRVAPVPITSADYEGPQKLFSAKRAAMILTGPWDIKPILDGSPDLDWGIAQALTRATQATSAAGTSMLIPRDAANPELAWDLAKRLTALDVELATTTEANMTMPRKSWAADPNVQQLERIAPFGQGLQYSVDVNESLRLTGKFPQISELFNLAYEEAIYRNRPASEVLTTFVNEGNAILAG